MEVHTHLSKQHEKPTGYEDVNHKLQDVCSRQPDIDAELFLKSVVFKRNLTRGHTVFFTATNVKDLQGDIDRDTSFMREENRYQQTPLTREWCDTHFGEGYVDLTLGFKPYSPACRVRQDSEYGSGYSGTEYDLEDYALYYKFDQDPSSTVGDDAHYFNAYGEDFVAALHVNPVGHTYHDDDEDDAAYWEWCPRHNNYVLVHLIREQEANYWNHALEHDAHIYVSGVESMNNDTLNPEDR